VIDEWISQEGKDNMDKEYQIEFFPKWFTSLIKIVPLIGLIGIITILILDRAKPPIVREVMVYEEKECDTIQDITSVMYNNDIKLFSVKRVGDYSFEVFQQKENGEINRVIHSWE